MTPLKNSEEKLKQGKNPTWRNSNQNYRNLKIKMNNARTKLGIFPVTWEDVRFFCEDHDERTLSESKL